VGFPLAVKTDSYLREPHGVNFIQGRPPPPEFPIQLNRMKSITQFVKTTLIGGLLVLFPLFACAYLVVRVAGALTSFIRPWLSFVPQKSFMGGAFVDVASVLILLFLCFLTGVIIQTSIGGAIRERTTRHLNRIPGYRVFSRIARILFDHEDPSGSPVMVQRGSTKQIGFLIEENSERESTIFFPSAPSPFTGSIVIVQTDKVERLNVSAAQVARVIASYGTGTRALSVDREINQKDAEM